MQLIDFEVITIATFEFVEQLWLLMICTLIDVKNVSWRKKNIEFKQE